MKRLHAIFFTALLAGCASGPPIDRTFTAVSQDSRAQFLIIHYTAMDFPGSLKALAEGVDRSSQCDALLRVQYK